MKGIRIICAALIFTLNVSAQAPNKMSYQAVIRNNSNALVTNQVVGMRISILQGSSSGTAVYVETHMPNTNSNGLASIEIGGGVIVSGNMDSINWENGPYFISTETDPNGGTSYSIIGTSQLLSVPYALHSNCVPVKVSTTGDTLTIGCHSVIVPGVSAANSINGVNDPYPAGTIHCNTTPTAVVDVLNPITGKYWMDRNLGASQVAASSLDVNAYGDLYQWGRRADGHQCRTSAITSSLSSTDQPTHGDFISASPNTGDWLITQNNNLWQGVNGINNPCPNGYRIPTQTEWDTERYTWSSNNSTGAFASPLKLTLGGARGSISGNLSGVNSFGNYWSSNVIGSSSGGSDFGSSGAGLATYSRALGVSVRCIKN
ncbi:MAG: hypothetical protein ACK5D5_13185 [Bacteroidota bacterium]|jgi:uncharacterized protein (TIGR02145 family)